MRIPFSWLKDFVDIPDTAETLAEKLRRVGVPVAQVDYQSPGIKSIYSAKILEMKPHPNADRLRIAQVDITKEKLQIVTGAANVQPGDIIPLAVVGAVVSGGKAIKDSKLRGEASYGMMCSANELGISLTALPKEQQEGVLVLDPQTPVGIDLSAMLLLNEPVLVLEPFANRPDYLSIFGVAREVAAIYGTALKLPKFDGEPKDLALDKINIELRNPGCKRYIARYVTNVKIKPSPLPLALRLMAAGIRPINNVVDITNIVPLEFGQPLHAFDYDRLTDKTIETRLARRGEKMLAIDGKTYELSETMLVIGDSKQPLAIAGIMGGKETEITDNTTTVLLETANFDPGMIRRTSLTLGLRTESSRRFEKGLDPLGDDWGSRRACYLLAQIGATIHPAARDVHEKLPEKNEIRVRRTYLKNLLGTPKLQSDQIETILKNLGFEIKSSDPLMVKGPIFRTDIVEEVDCIEEVARHYGYDEIPVGTPRAVTVPAPLDKKERFEDLVRDELRALGLKETLSYSLGDPAYYQKFGENVFGLIQNPLTEDRKALRPLLYPGMLVCLRRNLNQKNTNLAFFELGKVFEKIEEKRSLAVVLTEGSVFTLKGILEKLWRSLHLEKSFELKPEKKPGFHPERYASIEGFGFLGELHPEFLSSLEIEVPVVLFEINLDRLEPLVREAKFKALPTYPESRRDISLIVDEKLAAGKLVEKIQALGNTLVESVNIFDLYRGTQIPAQKKSLTLAVTYRAPDRTLTEEEISSLHEKIKKELESTFNAVLRIG